MKWTLFLLLAASSYAADYFPLTPGNRWVYQTGAGQMIEIRAGRQQLAAGDRTYTRITGYAAQSVWLRKHETGNVYVYDDETSGEAGMTLFEFARGARFDSRLAFCPESLGEVQEKQVTVNLGDGVERDALHITYQNLGCADVGVTDELYVDGIGLVRRTITTFTGPRTYNLVYARVGGLTFSTARGMTFQFGLDQTLLERKSATDAVTPVFHFELTDRSFTGVEVATPFGNEFDFIIRDAAGNQVYKWSDGRVFPAGFRTEQYGDRRFDVSATLTLPDGVYRVEGWLVDVNSQDRLFASTLRFEIRTQP